MEKQRVVITGMGIISPLGSEVASFWTGLVEGRSGISKIEGPLAERGLKTSIAGIVNDFDADAELGKKHARRMDRFAQFAVAAADRALADSGLDMEKTDRERVGVYVGSGIGGIQSMIDNAETLRERGPDRVSPSLVPMMIANMAAAQISIRLGAMGPSLAPVTACAIGNTAIGEAFRLIRSGGADVVFAGGAEAAVTELSIASFTSAGVLSTREGDPAAASRPFDGERDGFVMSEGAAIVVLETLDGALKRGANIYAEVIGYGASSDAYHVVATHPEGAGAYLAMKLALQDAGVTPREVDVISAHATGTQVGDKSETAAIKRLFGDDAGRVPVTANKSMLGHMLGAAGGAEAIALAMSLRECVIPPTINLERPDPDCDLDYVPNKSRQQQMNIGISNSFGFGGHNAVLVLKRFERP